MASPSPYSASQYPSSSSSYHAPPRSNVSEIVPRVFISDLSFAEDVDSLASYGITHILSVLPERISIPSRYPQHQRLQIKVEDFPFAELAAHLPTTTKWIWDALRSSPEARVLVHCAEGISRSVSVVAAFLMAQHGWTPLEAVRYIQSRRTVANPNFGFVNQLHEYARDVLGRT